MNSKLHVVAHKARICALLVSLMPVFGAVLAAQEPTSLNESPGESLGRRAVLLDIQGPIGPATADFLTGTLKNVESGGAELLIVRMDTPGGLDASTRDIIKSILNSDVPVATFVAPDGARAASAGMYILYASHIAAMSPATNVGAATPVSIIGGSKGGKQKPAGEDEEESGAAPGAGDTMTRKVVNDAAAYARSLAAKHGRNADWAELAVREAASITAEKALEMGVIDLIAMDIGDLLEQIDGRTVKVRGVDRVLATKSLLVEQVEPDWKSEMLAVITSPTIAYLLLMVGIYGLIFEGYNPGAILPGVIGAICLLIALYAFQMLPVNYVGFALIVLGIVLMIFEVMSPSFGVLGIGGIISMVIGSIILMDTDVPGFTVSRPLIGAIAVASGMGLMAIVGVAVKARQRPLVAGREEMIGAPGTALKDFDRHGEVFVHGERWGAVTGVPLREGQAVVVTGINGLTLEVSPAED